jgi:spore coat protein U-like protein
MKKLIVSAFLLTTFALTAASQTTTEKITGNWIESKSTNGSVVATKNWHFAADGNGTVEIKTKESIRLRCTTDVPFTWTITGDSIKIMSG